MFGISIEISRETSAACRPVMRSAEESEPSIVVLTDGNQTRRERREAGK
jgi:hypothetical protein